jgi:hypothetical protein
VIPALQLKQELRIAFVHLHEIGMLLHVSNHIFVFFFVILIEALEGDLWHAK